MELRPEDSIVLMTCFRMEATLDLVISRDEELWWIWKFWIVSRQVTIIWYSSQLSTVEKNGIKNRTV